MVERIVPKTPSLAKREQQAIDDIRELFPDGNVRGLDGKDKALGKRLSKLYRSLGYETKRDMIEAFGFTQVDMRGRWKSVNPEELFEELARRYEGKPKPKSLGILKHDNPDLLRKIKTVGNKCSETYGHSLTVELIQRGLLDKELPEEREFISKNAIRKAVSELEEKYSERSDKPVSIVQLKKLEPDYVAIIDSLSGYRCQTIYGTTIATYFRKVGILAQRSRQVDDVTVLSTLDALQEYYQSKDNEEKPKSMKALLNAHPEHADSLKAGKKRGIVTRESLFERGILGLSKTAIAERAKQLKRRCARNGTAEELARLYCGSGGVKLVVPDDKEECLRPGVVGIDIDAGYELRETTHLLCDDGLSVGDVLHVSWEEGRGWMEGRRLRLFKDGVQVGVVSRPGSDDFLDYRS